ncbi:hypothetical protein EW146_g161 [Bondarzewia mesenterica]|uniref:glutathione synthase n=1 Tax=Bondarzewia mesenterica TaxID=1095465 RepID=A0A4S4M7V3_9AGAM|nr:hypothetical protein EW146_g161 [Bondarzewia mesenterica]
MMNSFVSWPPELSSTQVEQLTLLATTYSLSHSLLYLPPNTPSSRTPPAPTSAIHAPFSLVPTPIPRRLFDLVKHLQRAYNVLYSRIAMDEAFLDEIMDQGGVAEVDRFTGELWRRWKQLRGEGIVQPLQLGLFRSDYLLHQPSESNSVSIKQVEFNTISSSFGALSQQVASLHKYLLASTNYFNTSPILSPDNLPPNETIAGLVSGLAAAHKAYGVESAYILFVVQLGERNVFDQRLLEYELLEKHSIHVLRRTFRELTSSATLHPTTRALLISSSPSSPQIEISTVYYRAGYTPTDYPTPRTYDTRQLLERSRAIQCPSLALQLAGGKKVQEVLTREGVLERFLRADEGLADVRASWMEMWALDRGDGDGPQREGGGNNVYKAAIPAFLDALPARERAAWIAMRLISPPRGVGGYLVRAGAGEGGTVKSEVVSELGVFGWSLFGAGEVSEEKEVGWLVRTKGEGVDEGGVATGFSVLDSVVLVYVNRLSGWVYSGCAIHTTFGTVEFLSFDPSGHATICSSSCLGDRDIGSSDTRLVRRACAIELDTGRFRLIEWSIPQYDTLLGRNLPPTSLWPDTAEQALLITIDNTSIFTPGSGGPQWGFRRTELIAQGAPLSNRTAFDASIETGVTAFHFSVRTDERRPLNYAHEYQNVFVEPTDGSHVFGLQIGELRTGTYSDLMPTKCTAICVVGILHGSESGTPFNTTPMASSSHSLKLLSHDLSVLFHTPFDPLTWHNFAVIVDWTEHTLRVLYSVGATPLRAVTPIVPNSSATAGADGQGEFHFGLLKLPLLNPKDAPAEQSDVVHYGIQEGTTEALAYSGVFVESVDRGVSVGNGRVIVLDKLT